MALRLGSTTINAMRLGTFPVSAAYLGGVQVFGGVAPDPIAPLFANGEAGVWYDPSDLTTLFQDTAGTTPVTAPGQTVALMLDKSKGLVLGPERVTNGTFDSDLTGWADVGTGTNSVVAGQANLVTNSINEGIVQNGILTVGKFYEVNYDLVSITGGSVRVGLGSTTNGTARSVAGTYSEVKYVSGDASLRVYQVTSFSTQTIVIDNISVRELPGFHAAQPTAAARPTYQVDAGGRGYLAFDGVDDFMVTPTITPGTDKAQVFAGVRKLSDAATGTVAELSASLGANAGVVTLFAPVSAAATYTFASKGLLQSVATSAGTFAAPITNVLTGIGDIAADLSILRINGTQAASNTSDQGTGNFLAYPLYIGRRGGTTLPFNGHLYSLITRFGPNLDTSVIESTEGYVAQKTGVEL